MFRVLIVLSTGLLLLMTVVILRVETARVEHQISLLDQAGFDLKHDIKQLDQQLSRLQNPQLIRAHVTEMELRRQTTTQPASEE